MIEEQESKWIEWLDGVIKKWSPINPREVLVSGQCLSMEACPNNPEADELYVEMLSEANLDAIDVYLWPSLVTRYEERYNNLIKEIRRHGKKLILGYQMLPRRHRLGRVSFRFEPYFKRPPTYDEFISLELKLTRKYIQRYKPYLYWVVVEPGTNEMRLGVKFTSEQWRHLVSETCRLVKKISPETLTGAAVFHYEYVRPFADVPELDVLGHDLYRRSELDEFEHLVALARRVRKGAWLAETWASLASSPGFDQPHRSIIDSRWLKATFNLAQSRGLIGMNIWFTTHFVAYIPIKDQADYERRFVKALKAGERTEVFEAVRELRRAS